MPHQTWPSATAPELVPMPPNQTRSPVLRRVLLTGIAVTLFLLTALFLTVILGSVTDLTGLVLAGLAASTALGIVVPVFLWVDRLESEPARLLWFAFLWGALVSTTGAIVLNELGMAFFAGLQIDPVVTGAVLVAPIVEEIFKCLGVLLIFLFAKREFNGVTDGIAYAGLVAVGFAFVENIVYLGVAFAQSGTPGLLGVFILRCLISPFAHPMFTVCFGLALGLVAHRRTLSRGWIPLLGLVMAVFLHALWNFAAVSAGDGFLVVYAVVQVPLFIGFVAMLFWARRRERDMMRNYLTGYGLNGWFTPAEVAMVASAPERRKARAWARQNGGRYGERAMEAFQDEAIALAVARKHIDRGDRDPVWRSREAELLHAIPRHRDGYLRAVAGLAPAG